MKHFGFVQSWCPFLILFWMKILTLNCRAKPIDHQDVIFALGWPCPQLPQSWKFTLKRCYELGRHSAFFFFDLCVYLFICSLSPWINSWLPFVNLFVLSSEHEKSSGCLGFCLGQLWAQVPLLHFQTLFPDCSKCCQTLNARFLSVTKWLILLEYVVIKWSMSSVSIVSEISKRRSVRSSISWCILCIRLWPDLSKCLPNPGMPPQRDSVYFWHGTNSLLTMLPLNSDKLVKMSNQFTVQRLYSVWCPVRRHSDMRKVLYSNFKLLKQKHSQSTCQFFGTQPKNHGAILAFWTWVTCSVPLH